MCLVESVFILNNCFSYNVLCGIFLIVTKIVKIDKKKHMLSWVTYLFFCATEFFFLINLFKQTQGEEYQIVEY